MNYEFLQSEIENGVALITINRPPVNPLNSQVLKELISLMNTLDQNYKVRVVILTGSGEKAFVAGADITEMSTMTMIDNMEMSNVSRMAFSIIENLSKPVIAAINGLALGGGFELALACDLRICSENAKFAFPEINLGIIPGAGGTQRILRIVGQGIAKELMYFGEMINAERAQQFQIVNKVVPQDELISSAKEWAEKLASKPPIALRMLKQAVTIGANVDLESGLTLESVCFNNAFVTQDGKEGMQAFIEKRKPVFVGK